MFRHKYWYETFKCFENNLSPSIWTYQHIIALPQSTDPSQELTGSPLLQIPSPFRNLDIKVFIPPLTHAAGMLSLIKQHSKHLIWKYDLRKKEHVLCNLWVLIYPLAGGNSLAILTCFTIALRIRTSSLCDRISWGNSALVPSYLLRASSCLFCIVFSNLFSLNSSCKDTEVISNMLSADWGKKKTSEAKYQVKSEILRNEVVTWWWLAGPLTHTSDNVDEYEALVEW